MSDVIEDHPWWSGMFNEFDGDDTGLMLVHDGDDRFHRPPMGWTLLGLDRHEVCGDRACALSEVEAFWFNRATA